jgi:uncharacterized protein
MYITRAIEDRIISINKTFPILLVTGPRQVGKTTMLKRMAESERKYVTLDDPTQRDLANREPALFIQRFAPPVLIDEIQYAPQLLPYIKMYVDEHKSNGDFWMTGSQTFHMMDMVRESLAGRVGVVRMMGLSNREINQNPFGAFEVNPKQMLSGIGSYKKMNLATTFQRIFLGSMPRLYEAPETSREEYFESYLATYIGRDIRDLTQVADELSFLRFVTIVAARTATNVNYQTLAQETGISAPTAKHWLSLLVSSGLVALTEPFLNNALKRVIKAPRMYFMDTGLAAYLTRWSSPETLETGAMSGPIFETWVVTEIYKSYLNKGVRPPMYFYRDSNQKEIDLILVKDDILSPIEIKKTNTPRNATKNFNALEGLTASIGMGGVICLSDDLLPIDANNWMIPAWMV